MPVTSRDFSQSPDDGFRCQNVVIITYPRPFSWRCLYDSGRFNCENQNVVKNSRIRLWSEKCQTYRIDLYIGLICWQMLAASVNKPRPQNAVVFSCFPLETQLVPASSQLLSRARSVPTYPTYPTCIQSIQLSSSYSSFHPKSFEYSKTYHDLGC